MRKKGFTFLEVVIILVSIGVLAAIVIIKFINFKQEAMEAAELGSIQTVRSGVQIYGLESAIKKRQPIYPVVLDTAGNAPASVANPFFGIVLSMPVTDENWSKIDRVIYKGPTGNYYYYEPVGGQIILCSGDKVVSGTGSVTTFLPGLSVDTYSDDQWAFSSGGLYSPWSGEPLTFTLEFEQAGTYALNIAAINMANHPDFTASLGQEERTDWHLPSGYTNFQVQVYIDGALVSPGNFNIPASDTTINTGGFLFNVGAGSHTVSFVWTNDV
ncbi:MAG: type II secretion system protein, partial [Candidatus Omnitrophota bacterium]